MQSVVSKGLDELDKALTAIIKESPKKRRELHERLGTMLKTEVDENISGSINDSSGHIKGWQEKVIGSGGGYAVVRAVTSPSGKNGAGAVTNYLESGHKIRRQSGAAKGKRKSRAKLAFVDGRHFYQKTVAEIEEPAIALAEKFVDDIAKKLGG